MKAIIFDFDGVIHDTFELGFDIHKRIYPECSREDFRTLFDGNLLQTLGKTAKDDHGEFRKFEFEAFKDLRLEREIREEIMHLSKDFDLYIISSNSAINLEMYFENNGFTNVFKEVLAAEAHTSKVEKFKILFQKYGFESDSCVFVTDTLGDILEANELGVKSIACTFGFHDEERLKKGNPFRIVSSFRDIRKVIERL